MEENLLFEHNTVLMKIIKTCHNMGRSIVLGVQCHVFSWGGGGGGGSFFNRISVGLGGGPFKWGVEWGSCLPPCIPLWDLPLYKKFNCNF